MGTDVFAVIWLQNCIVLELVQSQKYGHLVKIKFMAILLTIKS